MRRANLFLGLCLAFAVPVAGAEEDPLDFLRRMEAGYLKLVRQVRPSVVAIRVELASVSPGAPQDDDRSAGSIRGSARSIREDRPARPAARMALSGVIFDAQGHVVTVARGLRQASALEVELCDGRKLAAKLVGEDAPLSLAVLRLEAGGESLALQPARFAGERRPEVGALVVTVGNPLGFGTSVGYGSIAGLDRMVSPQAPPGLIQFTAPINPGDQGGLVADTRGEVVGLVYSTYRRALSGRQLSDDMVKTMHRQVSRLFVNMQRDPFFRDLWPKGWPRPSADSLEAKERELDRQADRTEGEEGPSGLAAGRLLGTEGIAFALPAHEVQVVAAAIISGKAIPRPFIGVRARELTPELCRRLRIAHGVQLAEVFAGGPAEQAGLVPGDIAVFFRDTALHDTLHFKRLVLDAPIGQACVLKVLRGGELVPVTVVLEGPEGEPTDPRRD